MLVGTLVVAGCANSGDAASAPGRNGASAEVQTLTVTPQTSGTEALLQAVSPVDDDIVWLSGHAGTFVVSGDGGTTWNASVVRGAEALQFRDVAAFDARTAYLMTSGAGDLSRIYRTDDSGVSWSLQYIADHPAAFLDCMDFWTPERGLVYGDNVDGVPFLLQTDDGGASWTRVPADVLPPALDGEGGFAASGTCLRTPAPGTAFVAMGNGARSRVLSTDDYGASWRLRDVPVVGGSASGLSTIDVGPDGVGVALGGIIGNDTIRSHNVTITVDGGTTWTEGGALAMAGPVYGAAIIPNSATTHVVAVGPRGMDHSPDGGRSWVSVDTVTYWAVDFSSGGVGWAVGPSGRVVRLDLRAGPVDTAQGR